MAVSSKRWQELVVVGSSESPKIFYCFDDRENKIQLSLTDLVAIWTCSMGTSEIKKTAKSQKSSIDPSESKAQTKVLLQKLEHSLDSGTNQLIRKSNVHDQVVQLRTEMDLPKPLRPLQWTFELKPQPAEVLAEQLLRPCLYEASLARKDLSNLRSIIKAKDHVITKLLERIESAGTDMSLIFPGITGLKSRKGTVSVTEAKKHVTGLAEFTESEWRTSLYKDRDDAFHEHSDLSNLISGFQQYSSRTPEQHQGWLDRLPRVFDEVSKTLSSGKSKAQEAQRMADQREDDDTTEDDEDFERQATPSHLRTGYSSDENKNQARTSSPPSKKRRVEIPSKSRASRRSPSTSSQRLAHNRSSSTTSTATESDEEERLSTKNAEEAISGMLSTARTNIASSSPQPRSPTQKSASELSSRRLGRIGTKIANTGTMNTLAEKGDAQKNETANGNSDVDMEDDDDDDDDDLDARPSRSSFGTAAPAKSTNSQDSEPPPAQKPIGRLGRIGNKKKTEVDSSPTATTVTTAAKFKDSDDNVNEERISTEIKEKSISAGSDKSDQQDKMQQNHVIQQNASRRNETEADETPEQKANRRREELKQALNKAPSKKKRKF